MGWSQKRIVEVVIQSIRATVKQDIQMQLTKYGTGWCAA